MTVASKGVINWSLGIIIAAYSGHAMAQTAGATGASGVVSPANPAAPGEISVANSSAVSNPDAAEEPAAKLASGDASAGSDSTASAPSGDEPPPGAEISGKSDEPLSTAEEDSGRKPNVDSDKEDDYTGPPTVLARDFALGAYGGLSVAYTRIDGKNGALVGGEGALLFDHRLSVGVAGHGWVNESETVPGDDGIDRRMQLGYGGVVLRYAFLTDHLVYASAGALVGGGAVAMVPTIVGRNDAMNRDDVDPFFVFEPQLSAHSNLTRWMRVGLHAGYRFVGGVSDFGYDNGSISGPVFGGSLQFGWL